MSRIPPPSSVRSSSKPKALAPPASRARAASPSKPSGSAPSTARVRTKSTPQTPSKSLRRPVEDEPPVPKTPISIKDAIALKRAEARKADAGKAAGGGSGLDDFGSLEDALPTQKEEEEVADELGRWSIKETIERARSTGSMNISSRSLPCIPSALFEIHLGITPDPLRSVPSEPPIGTNPEASTKPGRGGRGDGNPSWFEAQDLHIIKAWNNEITEIQPEISLFGSLKVIDLHKNKLNKIPDTFSDLSALTSLDVSYNSLNSLPSQIFALPNLATLNISHNAIAAIPFGAPFAGKSTRPRQSSSGTGSFFAPVVTFASTPLPRLVVLDASHNRLTAATVDHVKGNLPSLLSKLDLSANPLGDSQSLIRALGALTNLKEICLQTADVGDESFPPDLLAELPSPFPVLRVFNMSETRVTGESARAALAKLNRELNFDFTTDDPPAGVVRVLVGKKVIKEAWELEAERRARMRTTKVSLGPEIEDSVTAGFGQPKPTKEAAKEIWEIEAEQGLLTGGGRRRARAAAAVTAAPSISPKSKLQETRKEVQKEKWEIEAEQGLLTEGGRRRARAAAAEVATNDDALPSLNRKPSSLGTSMTNPQYYSEKTLTLSLPSLAPASKGHARAFSHASSAWSSTSRDPGKLDIALPTQTLPLAVISSQPFAQNLKVLTLTNRRLDVSLSLPLGSDSNLLPNLEELKLDGCGLRDTIPVSRQEGPTSGTVTPPRANEHIIPLLIKLFPRLRTLDLSDNALTSACLQTDVLTSLILATPSGDTLHPAKSGLKQLRFRGNRFVELDGLQGVAELFKGNRTVPEWKLEELDLRDNEIGKLPPELGLLPLDVFLVDGNVFRVPQRRVWEREGTKGLLGWLRGRIE